MILMPKYLNSTRKEKLALLSKIYMLLIGMCIHPLIFTLLIISTLYVLWTLAAAPSNIFLAIKIWIPKVSLRLNSLVLKTYLLWLCIHNCSWDTKAKNWIRTFYTRKISLILSLRVNVRRVQEIKVVPWTFAILF